MLAIEYQFFFFFKLIRDDFDVCLANDIHHLTTLISGLVCKIRKKPLIVFEHGYFENNDFIGFISKIYRFLFLTFIKNSSLCFFVPSRFMKKEIIGRYNISEKKVIVLPNFIDLKEYKKFSFKPKNYNNQKIILMIARFSREKGHMTALFALKELLKKEKNLLLIMVGGYRRYAKLIENLVKNLRLEKNVKLIYNAKDIEIKKMISFCDIIVIPSIYEPFGIVALEAMAYGKPIVASKVGGLKEILKDGKNSILFRPSGHRDLAKKILYLLDNEKIRKKISSMALKDVKKYDIKYSKLERKILKCIKKRNQRF